MEAVAAACGASVAGQPSRREWRAVSENNSFRGNGGDFSVQDVEHGKMVPTDERTIYEEGAGPPYVDFCSIPIDRGSANGDTIQQRIAEVARKRMGLQEMEIGLRAQTMARLAIADCQSKCEEMVKDQVDAAAKLKEQLQEKELHIHDFEMKLDEKERELRALQLDSEAAWAKEDLLREQNKELASFRRERDNSEAERAHHLKQIHDLKQRVQEKEAQILELQEQHRVAQETIIYKDEQLREAQAWIARVQEMDALQSTTNQSLQAELRKRTEQFNQYWTLYLRQYADMERHFIQIIQQLQLELNETKEQSGPRSDDIHTANSFLKHPSTHEQSNGSQFSGNGSDIASVDSVSLSNGGSKNDPSLNLTSNVSTKTGPASGVPFIAMGAYGQPSQVNFLQPFIVHPQGALHPVASTDSQLPQSQICNVQVASGNRQIEQAGSKDSEIPTHIYNQPSVAEHIVSESIYGFAESGKNEEYLLVNDDLNSNSMHTTISIDGSGSTECTHILNDKLINSSGKEYLPTKGTGEILSDDSQCLPSVGMTLPEQNIDAKSWDEISPSGSHASPGDSLVPEQQPSGNSTISTPSTYSSDASESNIITLNTPEASVPPFRVSTSLSSTNSSLPSLLDEKSLLACIVRAIPTGATGKIRISTTLPNRLGKMLAPFYWHDYRKQYGKLDDFVNRHPELFVIEEDFIYLREGAQEIVSANAAAARFAAAASVSAPYSSHSIAVTPIPQGHRQKGYQSADVKYTIVQNAGNSLPTASEEAENYHSRHLTMKNQQFSSAGFDVLQGLTNVKIRSKSKGLQEMDFPSDHRSGQSTCYTVLANGTGVVHVGLPPPQVKVLGRCRNGPIGRQQGRPVGGGILPRR